jgi:hypothetical protein
MPYAQFDTGKLKLLPLSERDSDLHIPDLFWEQPPAFNHPDLDALCEAILAAREKGAAVIMMYGAHVIRAGCSRLMIQLMEAGLITHFAANGAGAIHDFELAMAGATCESVERYISEGQFGLWTETGKLNEAVNTGVKEGFGFGEAAGRYITENRFPHAGTSVLAAGYRCRVPVTVHVSLGCDIVHEHPNCDGAAIGKASMTDFLIYAKSAENLENGVFLNVGSAVTGPEVYLKCLAMARNAAKQENRKITDFTTAVMDIQPLGGDGRHAPPKTNPQYYFRPWKTILARTVADGGRSYYIQGDHRETFGNLAVKLLGRK